MMVGELSLFLKKVDDTAKMRVLEFFIEGRELDYCKQDIIEITGLSRTTVYGTLEDLLNLNYILESRLVGKTQLYTLNMENLMVQSFIKIFDDALNEGFKVNKIQESADCKYVAVSYLGSYGNDAQIYETKDAKKYTLFNKCNLFSVWAA